MTTTLECQLPDDESGSLNLTCSPFDDEQESQDVADYWIAFAVGGSVFICAALFRASVSVYEHCGQKDIPMWVLLAVDFVNNYVLCFAVPSCFFLGGMQKNFDLTLLIGIICVGVVSAYFFFNSWCCKTPADEIVAMSKYENITEPLLRVVVLAAFQLTLLAFYAWSLVEAGRPDFEDQRVYAYYFCGILIQVAYSYDKRIWEVIQNHGMFWSNVLTKDTSTEWQVNQQRQGGNHLLFVRFLLSSLVNLVGFWLTLWSLPLQVATHRSPLDFVLNCVAAFYIIELDDLAQEDQVTFTKVLKQVQDQAAKDKAAEAAAAAKRDEAYGEGEVAEKEVEGEGVDVEADV